MSENKKDDLKPSISFQEMLARKNFSVPDEAHRLYTELQNPLDLFIEKMREANVPEITIERLLNLVNQNVGYYKRKLECLKIIATFTHAKPATEPKAKPPQTTDADAPKKSPNPYADMTAEELISGLPKTNESFDSGPAQPGS